MKIPNFVKVEHDTAARKAFVTVDDSEVKTQRAMWGMLPTLQKTISVY